MDSTASFELQSQMFGPRRSKGNATKIKLVQATIKCLAENGLEQASFEAIGKELGMGRANVRYHYKDKEDLFLAAVRFALFTQKAVTFDLIQEQSEPLEKLRAVVAGAYDWLDQYPDQMKVWSLFWYFAATKPHYRAIHAQFRNQATARIGHILDELSEQQLGAEMRGSTAKILQSLITGDLIECATGQKNASLHASKLRTWQGVSAIVAAIRKI